LNSAFWALGGLDLRSFGTDTHAIAGGIEYVRHDRRLIEQGEYFFASSHIPAHELKLPDRTFSITILRDPVQRVRSLYRYLCWIRDNPQRGDAEPYIDSLSGEAKLVGSTVSEFLARLPRRDLLRQLFMFSPRLDVEDALGRILQCDGVAFTETLGEDLAHIGSQLGLDLKEKHERRFGNECSFSRSEMLDATDLLSDEIKLVSSVKKSLRGTRRAAGGALFRA
jgi:hypothetical protein